MVSIQSRGVHIAGIKLQVFSKIENNNIPTLLYGCESWAITEKQKQNI
jgi:hypothetical protein